jgi:hypothetical protein
LRALVFQVAGPGTYTRQSGTKTSAFRQDVRAYCDVMLKRSNDISAFRSSGPVEHFLTIERERVILEKIAPVIGGALKEDQQPEQLPVT